MRQDYKTFAIAGLGVAAISVALAHWFGDGDGGQRTSLIVAAALAVGDVAAALWAAGASERARRLMAWVRVGLVAAALNFVGLWLIVIPLTFLTLSSGVSKVTIVIALIVGALLVWATHRLAWRRAAPKPDAP